jgi:hypothetical protein
MGNALEFILKLTDMLTPSMRQAAQISESSAVKIQSQFDKITNKGKTMGASLNELRSRLEAVNQVRFSTQYAKEFDVATRAARRLENQIQQIEGKGKAGLGIGGMIGGAALGYGAFELAKSSIGASANREQQQISFEVMTGSKDVGNKLLKDLVQMGIRTPFTSGDLIKNAELLKGFGVETTKILPTLNMLGDISRGNADKLGLMSLAYAQATSAGKLMGQDLLQMINAGFNPLQQMIKDKVFPNMAAARKAMEGGAISAKMLEAAFASATGPGGMFYKMMEKQSQTIAGRWSTLIDNVQQRILAIGDALKPTVSLLIDFGTALTAGEPYAIAIAIAVGALAASLWGATIATNAMGYAQTFLNLVMSANPIGAVIAVIAGLVAIVMVAYNKVDWFRGIIKGTWEGLKEFGSVIKDYVINRFQELLSGVTGLGKSLLFFFKGEWKNAWEAGKQATVDLVGVGSKSKALEDAKKIGAAASRGYKEGVAELAIKPGGVNAKTANAGSTGAAKADYGNLAGVTDKAEKINQGGQRSIVINIGKQIEKIENHIVGGSQQVADEIEAAIKEGMRRALLSINAQVSS